MPLYPGTPAPAHPGYVSGVWYGFANGNGTTALSANRLYFTPFFVEGPRVCNGIGVGSGVSVVGTAKLGIFTNSDGNPGTLVAENNADISTAATGSLTGVFDANPTLNGWYWLAVCCSAAAQLYQPTQPVAVMPTIGSGTAADAVAGYPGLYRTSALTYVAGGASFFPTSAGAVTRANGLPTSPLIALKFA